MYWSSDGFGEEGSSVLVISLHEIVIFALLGGLIDAVINGLARDVDIGFRRWKERVHVVH